VSISDDRDKRLNPARRPRCFRLERTLASLSKSLQQSWTVDPADLYDRFRQAHTVMDGAREIAPLFTLLPSSQLPMHRLVFCWNYLSVHRVGEWRMGHH
jgi:hypothetical protein